MSSTAISIQIGCTHSSSDRQDLQLHELGCSAPRGAAVMTTNFCLGIWQNLSLVWVPRSIGHLGMGAGGCPWGLELLCPRTPWHRGWGRQSEHTQLCKVALTQPRAVICVKICSQTCCDCNYVEKGDPTGSYYELIWQALHEIGSVQLGQIACDAQWVQEQLGEAAEVSAIFHFSVTSNWAATNRPGAVQLCCWRCTGVISDKT